jgi:hypothetical protein
MSWTISKPFFGEGGSNIDAAKADPAKFNLIIEIANYIKLISQRFFQSHYKIDRLALYNGDIRYVDYSLGERFSLALDPISNHLRFHRQRSPACTNWPCTLASSLTVMYL